MITSTSPQSLLGWPGAVDRVLAGALLAFYALLPLDLGFPTVPLFGRPLKAGIAATLIVLGILVVRSRGAVLRHLLEPYCQIQVVYTCFLVVEAFRAPSLLVALHWTILYFSTFVLNYVILRYVTRSDGVGWLSAVIAVIGVAAASVSIVQAVLRIPLPMYRWWYEQYFRVPPMDYTLPTARADGTMSNPILYCMLMALVIPYVFDLKKTWVRAAVLFTIMFAAALSGSRTVVFVVAVFGAGAFAVYGWAAVRALPAVGLGLLLLAISMGLLNANGPKSRLDLIVERLGLLVDPPAASPGPEPTPGVPSGPALARASDAKAQVSSGKSVVGSDDASKEDAAPEPEVSAVLGVSLRRAVVLETLREMKSEWGAATWVLGRGTYTAGSVGQRIQPWYNTVDNVFLNAAYERGLVGLLLFVGAFLYFLILTRHVAATTLHWFAPIALAVAGVSFVWDAFSMFNILVVASMAVTMSHAETARGGRRLEPPVSKTA